MTDAQRKAKQRLNDDANGWIRYEKKIKRKWRKLFDELFNRLMKGE